MKSVLISIQPKWCELIANSKKTVEVRKTRPKLETPFKCYIYCTESNMHDALVVNHFGASRFYACNWKTAIPVGGYMGNGKVVGEFVCDSIRTGRADTLAQVYAHNNPDETCLTDQEIVSYATYGKPLYFWHISDLKIYDKPKELGEFRRRGEYCDDCKFLNKDIHHCKKFGAYLVHYEMLDWYFCCEECLDENCKITRPPQSWCYVEEI